MNFIIFSILFIIVSLSFSIYLFNPKKKLKKFFFFFFILLIIPFSIYLAKGNLKIFDYDKILKEELLSSEELDPKKLIIFLERNLDHNSEKLEDFLILARSYVFNGYIQKANSLYLKCLKLFPDNEQLMLEVALFKKKNNDTSFAIKLFEDIYELNPKNLNNISNYIETIFENNGKKSAIEKVKEFEKDGHLEKKIINRVLNELEKN